MRRRGTSFRRVASRRPLRGRHAETPGPRYLADQLLGDRSSRKTLVDAIAHTLNDSEYPTDVIGSWLETQGIEDEDFELAYDIMHNIVSRVQQSLKPSRH